MTIQQRNTFDNLLTAWREHQELRDCGASIADLNSSRARLDDARLAAITAR
ncbi:MAG: hypothetical protein R8J94_08380 [Acidimicrobiia bacterium]|nr:hypothetical protein [Acidimicrobiia bacterium]